MKSHIDCHLCGKELRQYNFRDKTHFFTCDTDWCPVDDYEVKVKTSPKKQTDGSYLSVM